MKKVLMILIELALLFAATAVVAAPQQKHTIKASSRPYKALGHAVKAHVLKPAAQVAVGAGQFSFAAFDAVVIDPFGVALQGLADGVDMFVAQPLEALPKPLNVAGKGIHYIYLGVDKVGEQLAK